jgi:hypothetical protein
MLTLRVIEARIGLNRAFGLHKIRHLVPKAKRITTFGTEPEPQFTILPFRRWPLGCPEKDVENGQGYSVIAPAVSTVVEAMIVRTDDKEIQQSQAVMMR